MKQKSSFSIKDVVAIGVGAALFVVIACDFLSER